MSSLLLRQSPTIVFSFSSSSHRLLPTFRRAAHWFYDGTKPRILWDVGRRVISALSALRLTAIVSQSGDGCAGFCAAVQRLLVESARSYVPFRPLPYSRRSGKRWECDPLSGSSQMLSCGPRNQVISFVQHIFLVRRSWFLVLHRTCPLKSHN